MTNAAHVMQPLTSQSESHLYHRSHCRKSIFVPCSCSGQRRLELVELLDLLAGAGKHAEDVEADLRIMC